MSKSNDRGNWIPSFNRPYTHVAFPPGTETRIIVYGSGVRLEFSESEEDEAYASADALNAEGKLIYIRRIGLLKINGKVWEIVNRNHQLKTSSKPVLNFDKLYSYVRCRYPHVKFGEDRMPVGSSELEMKITRMFYNFHKTLQGRQDDQSI